MIYLVRHGETDWNRAGRQQGRLDSPLTENGVTQVRAVARKLRQLLSGEQDIRIESSPLGRAMQSAVLIATELGLPVDAITVAPLLIEHNLGVWQGLTFEEIYTLYPAARRHRDADKWTYVVEGGESYAQVIARARQWLAARTTKVTVAVTHEMISRTIQGAYAALAPEETLRRSHPHDCIHVLHDGTISEIRAESERR
jgi:probable phosphoglycerate mutase